MKIEPNHLSATEAIHEILNGDLTASELMAACAKQIKEKDPDIKAWVYFDEQLAMDRARAVDEKLSRGEQPGKLCGVPIGIKDIFNTIDMPTCMGSPIWEGFTPGNDARVVSYLKWADAVVVGKTVTAEFAVHHPGPTVNPHNFAHTPGTSSSGSAAAVASYMVPVALGTQTAGSTIRPASYCGIFGFKPSFGLIPRTGILKTLDTLDHVAFFSRSVEDLHLMLEILRVRGPNFPYVHRLVDDPSTIKQVDDYPWRIAFIKTPVWNHAEKYAKDSIIRYVSKLNKLKGIVLEEVELPEVFNSAHDIHELIYTKGLSYYFKEEYEEHQEQISKIFGEMVESGRGISPKKYCEGLERQKMFIQQLDEFFEKYDVIITLSTSSEAPKGLYTPDKKDSCLIWTLCHVPSMNLPVFRSPNNLPFGAQVVSRRYRDYSLLNFVRLLDRQGLLINWKDTE
ncbi:MAG: amidase [Deltaproteobacteria bacterium]|nr:amidase [Deltaproteobacteria bacterium]